MSQNATYETSLGDHLVGISFNPGGHEQVNHIKRVVADLINYITDNGKDVRCTAIATHQLEDAAMWAVKSVTKQART